MQTPSAKSLGLEIFDGKCCYCGVKLNLNTKKNPDSFSYDHFLPSARVGKIRHHLNVLPSCRACNNKKGKLHPAKFVSQETIDDIMSYFNYVYYLLKRFRLKHLEELRQNYNILYSWMSEYTNIKKIDIRSRKRNRGRQRDRRKK